MNLKINVHTKYSLHNLNTKSFHKVSVILDDQLLMLKFLEVLVSGEKFLMKFSRR